MNNGHQEETDVGDSVQVKHKKIIYFSSGETLEEEEEEEEEEQEQERPPFREPERKTFSLKKVAVLVGRISLLACDFLGERLAGVLGLNAAKYQYAIDQYHHRHKETNSRGPDGVTLEGHAETVHLSPGRDGGRYGAAGGDTVGERGGERRGGGTHDSTEGGHHNSSYQDDDCLK